MDEEEGHRRSVIKKVTKGISLVVQWLKIPCLPMQGMWVQSQVGKLRSHVSVYHREDPACHNKDPIQANKERNEIKKKKESS